MASASMSSTSNASAARPTAFQGDEFSNNLFSDLAPLLTLFGEQVTKQFLSLSMGWADSFLLAMAPIGIMTVVVSAIRVGGDKLLKAIVGRARESKATAEAELLSSTSENVCELWGGNEIVRAIGEPRMNVFVIRKYSNQSSKVYDLKEVIKAGDYVSDNSLQITWSDWIIKWRVKTEIEDQEDWEKIGLLDSLAPNITLNVKGSVVSPTESWISVIVGVFVQGMVLTVSALVVHSWKWQKSGRSVSGYGYPCFLIGTLGIAVGLVLCSRVIEGSTTEKTLRPRLDPQMFDWRVVCLQRECIVSEQRFGSYCISNSPDDPHIRVSRLNAKQYNVVAALGTLISVAGFIVQFVGLRALHWSATIMQLGATLIMTAVRAWIRRGLSKEPITTPVPSGHELSWLCLHICGLRTFGPLAGFYESDKEYDIRNPNQTIQALVRKQFQPNYSQILNSALKEGVQKSEEKESNPPSLVPDLSFNYISLDSLGSVSVRSALKVRRQLQRLVAETSTTYNLAIRLATAIETTLDILTTEDQIQWRSSPGYHHFRWYMRSVLQHIQVSQGSQAIHDGISSELIRGKRPDKSARRMRCRGTANESKADKNDESMPYEGADLTFQVKRKRQEGAEQNFQWYLGRENLDSLLSLWSLSLHYREETENQIELERQNLLVRDQYNQNTELGQRSQMQFVRIISNETVELSGWSARWIGRGIKTFSVSLPDGAHLITKGFKNHPVFGIELSSIRWVNAVQMIPFGHIYLDDKCFLLIYLTRRNAAGSSLEDSTSSSRIQTLWRDFTRLGPDESYDSYMAALGRYRHAAEEKSETAVGSSRSLEEECAFEIFSSFMLALGEKITSIGGLTREITKPAEYDLLHGDVVRRPEEKLWTNSVINSMAAAFVDSGLGNELEAYTLIVSALKAKGLLPTELSAQHDSSHKFSSPEAPSDSSANPLSHSSQNHQSSSIPKHQSQDNSPNNQDDTIAYLE